MLDFLLLLQSKGIPVYPDDLGRIRVVLAGDGPWTLFRLRESLRSLLVKNVELYGIFNDCFEGHFGKGDEQTLEADELRQIRRELLENKPVSEPADTPGKFLTQPTDIPGESTAPQPAAKTKLSSWILYLQKEYKAIILILITVISIALNFPSLIENFDAMVQVTWNTITQFWPYLLGIFIIFLLYRFRKNIRRWFMQKPPVRPLSAFSGPREFVMTIEKPRLLSNDFLDEMADDVGFFVSDDADDDIDIPDSVLQSCREGLPAVVYEQRRSLRKVVILEERNSRWEQAYDLTGELAEGLEKRGIPVIRAHYYHNPEHCYLESGNGFLLDDLEDDRQGYLLMIAGSGMGIDADLDQHLLEDLSRWPNAVWLQTTPARIREDGLQTVSKYLPVFPATRDGLKAASQRLRAERFRRYNAPQALEDTEGLENLLQDNLEWTCACAIRQPLDPGIAEALRQKFFGYLPRENLAIILNLPGTMHTNAGFRFSRKIHKQLLRLTRERWPSAETDWRIFLEEIFIESEPPADSPAHLRWQFERALNLLQIDSQHARQGAEMLLELRNTPIEEYAEQQLDSYRHPEAPEALALRPIAHDNWTRKALEKLEVSVPGEKKPQTTLEMPQFSLSKWLHRAVYFKWQPIYNAALYLSRDFDRHDIPISNPVEFLTLHWRATLQILTGQIGAWHLDIYRRLYGKEFVRSVRHHMHAPQLQFDPGPHNGFSAREYPRGFRKVDAEHMDAFLALHNFRCSKHRFLFLMGPPGSGKTALLLKYALTYPTLKLLGGQGVALVKLSFESNAPTLRVRLESIRKRYDPARTTIILDGLDQYQAAEGSDARQNLEHLLGLCQDFRKIILACRSGYLTESIINSINYKSFVGNEEPVESLLPLLFTVAPLDEKAIDHYVRMEVGLFSPGRRRRLRNLVKRFPDLASRPMLLNEFYWLSGQRDFSSEDTEAISAVRLIGSFRHLQKAVFREVKTAPGNVNFEQNIGQMQQTVDEDQNTVVAPAMEGPAQMIPSRNRLDFYQRFLTAQIQEENREEADVLRPDENPPIHPDHISYELVPEKDRLYNYDLLTASVDGHYYFSSSLLFDYFLLLSYLQNKYGIRNLIWTAGRKTLVLELLRDLPIMVDREGLNLVGANLSGMDLSGLSLSKVNLSKAILSQTNLHQANLVKANLERAILIDSNLSWADLSNANLSRTDLIGAHLHGTKLVNTDLREAQLKNAILQKADASNVVLTSSNLEGANLEEAHFNNAILHNANLSGANLHRANFSNASLKGANLSGANLRETDFTNADLSSVRGEYTLLLAELSLALSIKNTILPQKFAEILQEAPELIQNGGETTGKTADVIRIDNASERFQRVLNLAEEEAIRLSHLEISSEHLLLGLLRLDGGGAHDLLKSFEVDYSAVLREIRQSFGPLASGPHLAIDREFNEKARQVLSSARAEARALSSEVVSTRFLLLALLKDRESRLARIMAEFGVDYERVRAAMRPPPPA